MGKKDFVLILVRPLCDAKTSRNTLSVEELGWDGTSAYAASATPSVRRFSLLPSS